MALQYSIIIPVYNVEMYLRECLESVLAQDSQSMWEAILVDDGSTDDSGKICEEYAANDSRFRVIHKLNGGLASARNAGLDIAQGEYILFLDSDDLWHSDLLSNVDFEISNSKADIIYFHYEKRFETENKNYGKTIECLYPLVTGNTSGEEWLSNIKGINLPCTVCAAAFSRVFLNEYHYRFDETIKYGEDHYFSCKAIPKAECIRVIDKVLYTYRQRSGSIMYSKVPKDGMVDLRKMVEVFRENPTEYMAKYYFGPAIRLCKYGKKKEIQDIITICEENKDILNYLRGYKYRMVSLMVNIFGFYDTSKLYMTMSRIKAELKSK